MGKTFVGAVVVALGLVLSTTNGVAQFKITSGDAEITFGGQLTVQANATSCTEYPFEENSVCDTQVPTFDWFMRKVRPLIDVKFGNWLEGRFQPDFAFVDVFVLRDAWVRFTVDEAARLTVGHIKRPYDGFNLMSSARNLTIENAIIVPGARDLNLQELSLFNLALWDTGLMLDGQFGDGLFRYWLGTFNGQSPVDQHDMNTNKQFMGRAQFHVEPGGIPIDIAGAAARTDLAYVKDSGEQAGKYYSAYELWVDLGEFARGPRFMSNFLFGENPTENRDGEAVDIEGGESFAKFNEWHAIASWKFQIHGVSWLESFEPLFRAKLVDPNTSVEQDGGWAFTPGFQLFFRGLNKLQVNWDIVTFQDDTLRSENSFKVAFQLHF
jgi:hypothetical protein